MARKSWVISTLALLITSSAARAEAGLSYLGLCSPTWNCQGSLDAFSGRRVIRTGWLEGTFGEDCPCATSLLNDRRRKEIRVHLTNGACVRNQRCGPYEPFAGETVASLNRKIVEGDRETLAKFGKAALKLRRRLSRSSGGLTCYVSPMLESDLEDNARTVLHQITAAILPDCAPVDSIVTGACLPNTICEKHGEVPRLAPPCIADMDGNSALELDVRQFFRNARRCDLALLWDYPFNCNTKGGEFIDPRARNCWKSDEYFKEIGSLLRRGG